MNTLCNSLLVKKLGGGVRLSINTLKFRLSYFSTHKWHRNLCNATIRQRQLSAFTLRYYWNVDCTTIASILSVSVRTVYRDLESGDYFAHNNIPFAKDVAVLRDYLLYNADVMP